MLYIDQYNVPSKALKSNLKLKDRHVSSETTPRYYLTAALVSIFHVWAINFVRFKIVVLVRVWTTRKDESFFASFLSTSKTMNKRRYFIFLHNLNFRLKY